MPAVIATLGSLFYNYHPPPPMRLCGISLSYDKIEKIVKELGI